MGSQHERETPQQMRPSILAGRSSGDLSTGLIPKNNTVDQSRKRSRDTFESSPPWDYSESYGPLPRINTNLKLTARVLLKAAHEGSPSCNIICSPLSLNFAMNMVAMGSRGDTLQQLLSFLGSSSLDDIIMISSRIMNVLTSPSSSGGPQISFANGIWVDQKFPLKPSFHDVVSNTCKAEVNNVEMKQAERVVEDVNSWVNYKTKGLIKDILKPQDIDVTTVIILANALYFKGVWADEFNAHRTKHRNFFLLNGETVSVLFMTSNHKYFYKACDGFKVLKVPYKSGRDTRKFSMYFLLPDKNDGLEDLLEKIDSDPEFLHQDFGLSLTAFDNFWLPKFKFSYTFEAKKVMKQLGLTLPFDTDCKDITEMVHSLPVNLYISKVIQKAMIDVDEKGTEAAAVTLVLTTFGCAFSKKIERYEFVADHPFLFMIKEEVTGAVLFVGTVSNPLEED